ncbi:putative membrane protein [Wickerhamomyces ciferrii]|uniref:Protein PNS1 n=1 Tax=Wickerhamomyces ciferrii (strain ATCC 14091 / BCRC 22168 / CBS 111 / JCM 3599 / NBRC 0793 / NRRL Y-1031 F-60-10) TaxID=1206466 RepID=K0KNF8_WICCF|nr:uncharacterized protein BN7_3271 [Wickerhamomyces ciferrii]CCH43717.1 putative membrane protein [Wickerhamomyces ciferrii]
MPLFNQNQNQGQQGQNQDPFVQPHEYQGEPDNNNYYGDEKQGLPNPQGQTFDEAFQVEKPKWNDIPFTIFFLAVVAGFIAVAALTLRGYAQTYAQQGSGIYNNTSSFTLNTNTVILFVFVIVVALIIAASTLAFARIHPKGFITTGIIVNIIMGIGTAIAYFVMHYYSAAVVFLVFTLISAWCYWSMRSRIPFSAEVLVTVIDVMKNYKSSLIVSALGLLVSGVFSILFSAVVVATYMKYDPKQSNEGCSVSGGGCSKGKLIGILVFVFFAGYYITEVIRNVIHVTISGIYGTWYYLSQSDQGQPKHPASGAFKRAMTYSFGSICFGSLIVTFIDLLKQGLNILRQNASAAGENCAQCGYLILDILLNIIEWLARFFNQYAYSYIALYGESYISSAKATWHLIRQKGIDALVNQCLVGTALGFYALFNAYTCALLAFLYVRLTKPEYNSEGTFYAPVVAFTFTIAMQISNIVTQPLRSGTSTFFIALARDPEVYQQSYPNRFNKIAETYPNVFDKLRSR